MEPTKGNEEKGCVCTKEGERRGMKEMKRRENKDVEVQKNEKEEGIKEMRESYTRRGEGENEKSKKEVTRNANITWQEESGEKFMAPQSQWGAGGDQYFFICSYPRDT